LKTEEYLKEALKRGKLHHSILLEGGDERAVGVFAKYIICRGECSDPSYLNEIIRIKPEGRSIGIAQIRDLIDRVSLKPFAAPWRLVVIEEADSLTAEAANALLKTLEEPPESTYFLLLTSSPSALPSTVLSRCLWLSWNRREGRKARRLGDPSGIKTREDLKNFVHNALLLLRDWMAWREGEEPLHFPVEEVKKLKLPPERLGDFLGAFDKIGSVWDRANLSIARAYLAKILREMGIG